MTDDQLMSWFERRHPPFSGGSWNLRRMQSVMAHLGNPQDRVPTIHIAGTSGKSSVAFAASEELLRRGRRPGLAISPHLNSIRERAQVAGRLLEPNQFANHLTEFETALEMHPEQMHLSYFEALMALSFWCFAAEAVDCAVVEVGLGGLLDPSNVIRRTDKVCLISRIGLDHTELLGDSIEDIAREKAGIIGAGNTVFTVPQHVDALVELRRQATSNSTQVSVVQMPRGATLEEQNRALAQAGIERLEPAELESTDVIVPTTPRRTLPGRGETVVWRGRSYLLDGAHNPQQLDARTDELHQQELQPAAVVLGLSRGTDERLRESLEIVARWCVPVALAGFQPRAGGTKVCAAPERLAELTADMGLAAYSVADLRSALESAGGTRPGPVLVTGSLYLVAEALRILRCSA